MHIITYSAEAAPVGFEFLAVIVDGDAFHPVTPFRSSVSTDDARAKAQAWWDAEIAAFLRTETGRSARAAAVSAAARKRAKPQPEAQPAPVIEEAF